MRTNEHNEQDQCKNYKIIKAIIVLFIIASIITIGYIFYIKNNAASQIKEFKSNISNDNYKSLANQLSTNKRNMTTEESRHLVDYFKTKGNYKKLNRELENIEANLDKKSQESELGAITDKNKKTIITFSKNGKKFLFFDKISIKPIYRDVYVKELNNTATYNFKKRHKVLVDKNRINNIGSFIVGDYDVPVEKVFKDGPVKGHVNGKIHINTDRKQDNKHIIADQTFNQTRVRIKLRNDSKLDNTKVYINDTPYKSDENRVYGYFPNDSSFNINATGEIDDNLFKTNDIDVNQTIGGNLTVNLDFNRNKIDKYIEKKKKNRKVLNKFMKSYTKDLSKAYENKEYADISDYIKDNSRAEKLMKPKFKKKQKVKYSDTKVNDIKKEEDLYKVDVTKKYKANLVKITYYIKKIGSQFQITKMEDKT